MTLLQPLIWLEWVSAFSLPPMRNEHFTKVVCFGPFELDVPSGELCSDGRKVQLQEQPFRILKLLTERRGELVTREEIQRRLWPNGTVVEFENAVNAAIKKLRIALGDSADEPHYIETVKRRGYRLIVPVQSSSARHVRSQYGICCEPAAHTGSGPGGSHDVPL